MPTYLATAYRWGWLNGHSYLIYCGSDLDKALAMASAERTDRGGKYGCEVTKFEDDGTTSNRLHYVPSSYGEDEPIFNWRIEMFEHMGHVLEDLAKGRYHEETEGGAVKLVDFKPPPELTNAFRRAAKRYEVIEAAWNKGRAEGKKAADMPPPGTREGLL